MTCALTGQYCAQADARKCLSREFYEAMTPLVSTDDLINTETPCDFDFDYVLDDQNLLTVEYRSTEELSENVLGLIINISASAKLFVQFQRECVRRNI